MTENVQPAPDTNAGELDALKAQIADLSTAVNNILKYVQDAPAIRKAGYVTEDGGKKDKNVKSFADFLLAVRRSDTVRLKTVYGTGYVADGDDETKDLGVNVGTSGGVLVPPDYSTQLLQLSPQDNGIVSRVTRVPVTLESGTYPSLDIFAAPTAGVGDTALAAGVTAAAKGEGATLGNTNPSFTELNWRVRKVGGYTKASNELIASSPQSIEALLTALFRIAIAAKTEYFILRGTGVGEPLGILNSAAAKSSSAASSGTYAYADALTMLSLFKPVSGVTAKFAWIMHPSLWPQIGKFQVGTSAQAWVANMQGTIAQQPLLGYPIIVSEHLPQHASSGDIILADLGAYLLFDREQLTIAFSEHIGFLEDQGTWRFTARMDGMPWMKNVITLPGPGSAYTVSPFVYNAN